jgi:hypothetical protein
MRASRNTGGAPSRQEQLRALAALLAAGLLIGATAVTLLRAASDWVAPGAAVAAATKTGTAPTPAPAPTKVIAPAKAAAPVKGTAPAKGTVPAPVVAERPSSGVRAAAVSVTPSPVEPARQAPKPAVPSLPAIEEQVTYQYNALGRRDPFVPMAGGTFIGEDVGGDAPPDIGGIKVVGIVWGTDDKFALIEDARGGGGVLRAGDKVMNGVVETLKRDGVVVKLTVDGQTETVTIPLTRKGDQTNANR